MQKEETEEMSDFLGCTAISCIRQATGKKSFVNYLIEDTCRYARNGCTFKKPVRHEAKQTEQKAP